MNLRIQREHWIITISIILAWSLLLRIVFVVDMNNRRKHVEELLVSQGRMLAQNIIMTLLWTSSHDPVYVTESDRIQPIPHFNEDEQFVMTENGERLIRVTHGSMGRGIGGLNSETSAAIQPHIMIRFPSETPINPVYMANDWERAAFDRFRNGEFEVIDAPKTLERGDEIRYMAPLYALESCLSCHDPQVYQEGSLIGGLEITVRSEPYFFWYQEGVIQFIWQLIGAWIIGCMGIVVTMSSISKRLHERVKLNKFEGVLEMAGTAAHELNQPLQIISGYAELITMLDREDRNSMEEMLKEIRNNIFRISAITRKLNNITRYETIELSDSGRIVDLNRAASDSESSTVTDTPVDIP